MSESSSQWFARPMVVDAGLVLVSLACAAIYLGKGVGFVLDDWSFLRNARFDGALHAAGPTDGDRPVGALAYISLFGLIGAHPGAIVLVLAGLNGVSAAIFRRLLSSWWCVWPSGLAALLWVVLPLRTSLEVWMSTGTAVLAQLLALLGLLLARRPSATVARLLVAGCLIAAGTLSYESLAVLAVPVIIVMRWAIARRIVLTDTLVCGLPGVLALAWAYTHRLPGRSAPGGLRSPLPVFDANFGAGIAPNELVAAAVLVASLIGSVLVIRSSLGARPRSWPRACAAMVGVGWVVTLWGVSPYLTYYYSPYGAGDRLNALSAFGAAMVWAGILASLRDHRPAILISTALLVASGLAARWERSELWSRAGEDGRRVVAAVVATHPDPDRPIVIGPGPIVVGNISNLYSDPNVKAALQLAYDDATIVGRLSPSAEQFAEVDEQDEIPFDQRPWSTLEDLIDDQDGGPDGAQV